MKWLILIFIGALFSGCVSKDAESQEFISTGAVPADELRSRTYYQFFHAGGALSLRTTSVASMELFSPADVRLGELSVGNNLTGNAYDTPALPPGDYVLRFASLGNGTTLHNQEEITRFYPLQEEWGRKILARAPKSLDPTLGILPQGATFENETTLKIKPADGYRLLFDGGFSNLRIQIRDGGYMVVMDGFSEQFVPPQVGGESLTSRTLDYDASMARNGELDIWLSAENLQGAIVLEWTTYSRATGVPSPIVPTGNFVAYPFTLDGEPQRFDVAGERLQFQSIEEAWVIVFNHRYERVAALELLAGDAQAIAVQPGEYIALATRIDVGIFTDRLPADFSARGVSYHIETLPQRFAPDGEYHEFSTTLDAKFFAVHRATQGAGTFMCHDEGEYLWRQGGHMIGHDQLSSHAASVGLLQDGPLEVQLFAFGGNVCREKYLEVKVFDE